MHVFLVRKSDGKRFSLCLPLSEETPSNWTAEIDDHTLGFGVIGTGSGQRDFSMYGSRQKGNLHGVALSIGYTHYLSEQEIISRDPTAEYHPLKKIVVEVDSSSWNRDAFSWDSKYNRGAFIFAPEYPRIRAF